MSEELDRLAALWSELDPVPEGLARRCVSALAMEDVDLEYELLHLVSRDQGLVGARAEESGGLTMTFGRDGRSVLLRVSTLPSGARRVDGWVAPAASLDVRLRQETGERLARSDETGRFELLDVPPGMSRLVLGGTDAGEGAFGTPVFEL